MPKLACGFKSRRFAIWGWTRQEKGREYTVSLLTLPDGGGGPSAAETSAAAISGIRPGPDLKVLVNDTIEVNGHPATRLCLQGRGEGRVSLTIGIGSRQLLVVVVTGSESLSHTDPKLAAFLENFKMMK